MAKVFPETPGATDNSPETSAGFEQQFLDVLGPSAGPEAYLLMSAIVEILDRIPDPALAGALETHIEQYGINRNLIVTESATSMIVANSPEHAHYLKRAVLFRKIVELGEAILRAPQ